MANGPVARDDPNFNPDKYPNKTRAYMEGMEDGQVLLSRMIIAEIDS